MVRDLLEPVPADVLARVTLLAAVVPYVPLGAAPFLPHEAGFEPARALFGGHDGLDVARELVDRARVAGIDRLLLELGTEQIARATWPGYAGLVHDADSRTAVLELTAR